MLENCKYNIVFWSAWLIAVVSDKLFAVYFFHIVKVAFNFITVISPQLLLKRKCRLLQMCKFHGHLATLGSVLNSTEDIQDTH